MKNQYDRQAIEGERPGFLAKTALYATIGLAILTGGCGRKPNLEQATDIAPKPEVTRNVEYTEKSTENQEKDTYVTEKEKPKKSKGLDFTLDFTEEDMEELTKGYPSTLH